MTTIMRPLDHITSSCPRGSVFRASSLQREYRRVLDCAREAPVQVLDRDDTLLGIERWDDLVFARGVVAALEQVGQFHAVYSRHREEPSCNWASMTPFPWLAEFDEADIDEFAKELLPHLFESLRRNTLDPYLGNVRAWESSAELLDDPDMAAALDIDIAAEQLVEIYAPSPDDGAEVSVAEGPARDQ